MTQAAFFLSETAAVPYFSAGAPPFSLSESHSKNRHNLHVRLKMLR